MKIDKVSYQRLYPIGSYLNERIGFEASLEEGESPEEAIEKLRILADHSHKPLQEGEDSFEVDKQSVKNYVSAIQPIDMREMEESPIPKNAPEEERIKKLIGMMSTCKDKKSLETYRIIAGQEPELLLAYSEQMQKFLQPSDFQNNK